MKDKLIDTNILVYAYDVCEERKNEIAKEILKDIWQEGGGVVCLQNLIEFFSVITRKVEHPISVKEAKNIIEDIIKSDKWIVIDRDSDTLLYAIDLVYKYKIHFWDSMIAACMYENHITDIITENKSDFVNIPNINIISPFN